MDDRWENDRVEVTFIWGNLIQDGLEQTHDGCGFAAVTRQIEYDIRKQCLATHPVTEIPPGQLFDHFAWHAYVTATFPGQYPTPHRLLKLARSSGVPVLAGPTPGGLMHVIETLGEVILDRIELTLRSGPLIGVFEITSNYCERGIAPFLGGGESFRHLDQDRTFHAVVLVGLARDRISGEEYYIFQNSHGPQDTMLRQKLSCVRKNLIIEAYSSESIPPKYLVRHDIYVRHFAVVEARGRQQRRDHAALVAANPQHHLGLDWAEFHEPPPYQPLPDQ